uniref:EXPERA domain-containing protein n=1 Tax=Hyaloperonospora arabidopsidis (strain Emoy2) TaxID=559515 RepID=M4BCC1_HYAAE
MTLALVLLSGACVRGFLYAVPSLHSTLSFRPELVTPTSSFHRIQEGVFLYVSTGSPYSGDVFHQPPLVFALFYPVLQYVPASLQYFIRCALFISVDLLLAVGFARLCANTLKLEEGRVYKVKNQVIWLSQIPVSPLFRPETLSKTVAFIALLNPYSVASSVAMSTETYVWVAKYSDLTPNVGIFWYLFIEVFDRFVPYFLFVLHLHPAIYVIPIYLRLA